MPRDDRPPAPPPSLRTQLDRRRARRVRARRALVSAASLAVSATVFAFASPGAACLIALVAFCFALVAVDEALFRED